MDEDGRDTVACEKAAKLLGVSRRTVYRYMSRGLLRRAPDGGRGVIAADVEALAHQLGPRKSARWSPIASNVLQLQLAELERLAEDIELVLDASRCPLGLSDDEARSLYQSAQTFAEGGWPSDSERRWALILLQLRSEDVRQIERSAEVADAWAPLLDLARALRRNCEDATLARLLAAAERNVVKVAVASIERSSGRRACIDRLTHFSGSDRNTARRAVRRSEALTVAGPQRPPISDCSPADAVLRVHLSMFEQQQAATRSSS